MSVSQKPEYSRDVDPERVMVAVNPREGALGDISDAIIRAGVNYRGDVIRLEDRRMIEDPAGFYSTAEEISEEVRWFDDYMLIDGDGLDVVDARSLVDDYDMFEYVGGDLSEIGGVHGSLKGQDRGGNIYSMMPSLVVDRATWTPETGYDEFDNGIATLDFLLSEQPENTRERLENAGLGGVEYETIL